MSAAGLSVTNFAVQYSGADATAIAASGHDLVILEAAPGRPAGTSDLSDAEVAALVASGVEVIGYVSVGQTDDARPYWDPAWTDDGTDTGNPTADAPAWMADAATSWPARIVEYWDPDWKAIVLDQVTEIATRGYSGIFLDNILSYYEIAAERGELGTAQSEFYAQTMIDLVIEIAATARAINPDFAVIANGGPYILGDAAAFGTSRVAQYMDAVDGIMAESFFGLLPGEGVRQENVLDTFESFWAANGIDVLALEYSTDQAAIDAYVAEAAERGFAPSISPDQTLSVLPDPLQPVDNPDPVIDPPDPVVEPPAPVPEPIDTPDDTPEAPVNLRDGNDGTSLIGSSLSDVIRGAGGDDTIRGEAGADRLFGGGDEDVIYGGNGPDLIKGGAGDDRLIGNGGDDTLLGGKGEDELSGGKGRDQLDGQDAGDTLYGGDQSDQLRGGRGADDLFGGNGSDKLAGGNGADVLVGGRGADRLAGGKGDDKMTGGTGADTFVFTREGRDTITDFDTALDELIIAGRADFTATARGEDTLLTFGNDSVLLLEDFAPSQVDEIVFG